MSFKLLKKIVSIFTVLTFIVGNGFKPFPTYANPDSRSVFKNKKVDYEKIKGQNEDVVQKKKAVLSGEDANQVQSQQKEARRILSSHLSDISLIHIPTELGRIVEVHQGEGSRVKGEGEERLIVHIQDLHTNPEAEYNLAKILEILLNDYKMGLVCSEGADGIVDTSRFSSFPDYVGREKVSRIFVNSGELTGEEYLSITKYPDLPIWGIEDKDIYLRNIGDFNKIMKFNPQSQVFISQAKKALEELKNKLYTKELLDLDQKDADYRAQKMETDAYVSYLTAYIAKLNIQASNYKNITLLIETMNKEKTIDQLKIMNEAQNLLLNLQSSLVAKSSLRSEADSLMAKAQLFKDQKISPFSFYSYLKDLANKHLKDEFVTKYSNLNSFVDYLTKVNAVDSTDLFLELENLNFEIKQALAKTDEQKTLVKAIRNINFLEGFFNLKVSNEELDYYLQNKEFHKVGWFKSAITNITNKTGLTNSTNYIDYNSALIDPHLTELEEFYKVVKDRDVAMVNNSISEIEKRNSKVSSLIAGGFHTKGITRLLKEKGYSYIVVSPYSKTDIDEENYHFLLAGKHKPLIEKLKQLDLAKIVNNLNASLRVALMCDFDILPELTGPLGNQFNTALTTYALTLELPARQRIISALGTKMDIRIYRNRFSEEAYFYIMPIGATPLCFALTKDGQIREVQETAFAATIDGTQEIFNFGPSGRTIGAETPSLESNVGESGRVIAGQEGENVVGKIVSLTGINSGSDLNISFGPNDRYKVLNGIMKLGDLSIRIKTANDDWFNKHGIRRNGVVLADIVDLFIVIRETDLEKQKTALYHELKTLLALSGGTDLKIETSTLDDMAAGRLPQIRDIFEQNKEEVYRLAPTKLGTSGIMIAAEEGPKVDRSMTGEEPGAERLISRDESFNIRGLQITLGNLTPLDQIKVNEFENGMVLKRISGQELRIEVKEHRGKIYARVGNNFYLVKGNKLDVSKINPLGNIEWFDFFGKKPENIKPERYSWEVPQPSLMKEDAVMLFPGSRSVYPSLLVDCSYIDRSFSGDAKEMLSSPLNGHRIETFIHNAVLYYLMNSADHNSASEAFDFVTKSLLEYLEYIKGDTEYGKYRKPEQEKLERLVASTINYVLLLYAGCDFDKFDRMGKHIRDKRVSEGKGEIKYRSSVTRAPTFYESEFKLPAADPKDWEVSGAELARMEKIEEATPSPEVDRLLKEGKVPSVPFGGGTATIITREMATSGQKIRNKMTHLAYKAVVRIGGKLVQKWINVAEARIAFIYGQSDSSQVDFITGLTGPILADTDRRIRERLLENPEFKKRIESRSLKLHVQRAGLLLNPQTGLPVKFNNGLLTLCGENHLWAFLAFLADKETVIDRLKTTSGIFMVGNGDNPLNYPRAAMVDKILQARAKGERILSVIAGFAPAAGDIKGGIMLTVTYRNKKTGETITRDEMHEISELPMRTKNYLGGIYLDKESYPKLYEYCTDNNLFLEDIARDKKFNINVAFYAVDIRLLVARCFDLDEKDPELETKLNAIDEQSWVDGITDLSQKAFATTQPGKKVMAEGSDEQAVGWMEEQAVQNLIMAPNLFGEDVANSSVELPRNSFAGYKGTNINIVTVDNDGKVVVDSKEDYDLIANLGLIQHAVKVFNKENPNFFIKRVLPSDLDEVKIANVLDDLSSPLLFDGWNRDIAPEIAKLLERPEGDLRGLTIDRDVDDFWLNVTRILLKDIRDEGKRLKVVSILHKWEALRNFARGNNFMVRLNTEGYALIFTYWNSYSRRPTDFSTYLNTEEYVSYINRISGTDPEVSVSNYYLTETIENWPRGSAAECLKDLFDNSAELFGDGSRAITVGEAAAARRENPRTEKPFTHNTIRQELEQLVLLGFLTKDASKKPFRYSATPKLLNAAKEQIDAISAMEELKQPANFPKDRQGLARLNIAIDNILAILNALNNTDERQGIDELRSILTQAIKAYSETADLEPLRDTLSALNSNLSPEQDRDGRRKDRTERMLYKLYRASSEDFLKLHEAYFILGQDFGNLPQKNLKPAELVRVIVSGRITPEQLLNSISDTMLGEYPDLRNAKTRLLSIMGSSADINLDELAISLAEFNKAFNNMEIPAKQAEKREIFNRIQIAKSLFAREIAKRYLEQENKGLLGKLRERAVQGIKDYVEARISSGDMGKSERNKLDPAKRFMDEWLDEPGMPDYIKLGIIRGMLEARDDDLFYAFGPGWREFGTAGIRNQAINSSFEAILLLELEEFAQNPHAAILAGPNTMNAITLLQQTATVKEILRALIGYVKEHPNAEKVSLRELMEYSPLYKSALAKGKTQSIPDVTIALPKEFKENLDNNRATFAFDSRLNAGYWARILTADLLKAGVKVDLFDRVSSMPALVYAAKMLRAIFGFLISASHSEPNYHGFKFVVGHLASQVDPQFQKMIMAFRNLIGYQDISLDLAREDSNPDAILRENKDNLRWFTATAKLAGFDNYGASQYNIYEEYDQHCQGRSPLTTLASNALDLIKKTFGIVYSAFSGAAARERAGDHPGFMERAGYGNVDIVEKHTREVNGKFPAFIRGWKLGMPDPGDLEACIINLRDYLIQYAGAELGDIEAAINKFNTRELFGAGDPDNDRAALAPALSPGEKGNVKEPLIKSIKDYIDEEFAPTERENVKARIIPLLQEKLQDMLHLTANDAWAFIVYTKLKMLENEGLLRKDKIYIIIKSHVTTSALEDVAAHFRSRGYSVYCVDTYVGFTLLAERADQLFNFSRLAWKAASLGATEGKQLQERTQAVIDQLPELEKAYEPIAGQIREIDELMGLLRGKNNEAIAGEFDNIFKLLVKVSAIDIIAGVEESNGYGEFGQTSVAKDAEAAKGKELEIVDEHIREKDGSLAFYIFSDLMVYLKSLRRSFHDAYLGMWRDLGGITAAQNDWVRFTGAAGNSQKVETIQAIEKELAFRVLKSVDHGEDVVFFNKYRLDHAAEPVVIFWDNKYDNSYRRFPEEGVRFNLVREYEGVTYKIIVVYRPSGTGMELRCYDWAIGVIPEDAKGDITAIRIIKQNVEVVLKEMVADFFGAKDRATGYIESGKFNGKGILCAMKEGKMQVFREIFAGALGRERLDFTEREEALAQAATDYALAARTLKGSITEEDRRKWQESLDENRIASRAVWKGYFESEEARIYPKKVEIRVNGELLIEVPKSMAITWSASLADYIVGLIEEKYSGSLGDIKISCDITDLVKLIRFQLEDMIASGANLASNGAALPVSEEVVARLQEIMNPYNEGSSIRLVLDRYGVYIRVLRQRQEAQDTPIGDSRLLKDCAPLLDQLVSEIVIRPGQNVRGILTTTLQEYNALEQERFFNNVPVDSAVWRYFKLDGQRGKPRFIIEREPTSGRKLRRIAQRQKNGKFGMPVEMTKENIAKLRAGERLPSTLISTEARDTKRSL